MEYEYGSACPLPECADHEGTLPPCAGLSVPYVPFQKYKPDTYQQDEALSNGTLFPGLNLPFYLKENGEKVPDTPMAELQALQFVVLELGTYLDTHPEDQEAFAMFKQYTAMEKAAKTLYEKEHGPLTRTASASDSTYTWLKGPWPWCYPENEVK